MTDPNPDSILDSVKKAIGLTPDMTQFDLDIVMHINAVIGTLQQLGVNSDPTYFVADNSKLWLSLTNNRQDILNLVKTYTFMHVKFIFDPPDSRFAGPAIEKMLEEFKWRIQSAVENGLVSDTTSGMAFWWDITGLSDFPAEAKIGDFGYDVITGNVYEKVS